MNEITPRSPEEKAAALKQLIEELTGFIGSGETRRSTNMINLPSREDMLDRLAYYRGWMSEGTFPKLKLHVLDATSTDVRFPHLMVLTGQINENIAFLSDKDYDVRVKKYVSKGKLEMADSYQDFDMPGCTNANRLNLDFSRKVLQPGYYSVSLILVGGAALAADPPAAPAAAVSRMDSPRNPPQQKAPERKPWWKFW